MRSGQLIFAPFRTGLIMYLTRNLVPEASGARQLDQSDTIHGSGTGIKQTVYNYLPYYIIKKIFIIPL